MSVVTAAMSSQLGRLVKYGGEKKLLTASYVLYAAALLLIPVVPNIWMQIIPLIIFGMAHGINIPATQILLAGIAPIEFRGAFMSFNGMVLRLGQTLGPLIMGLMFTLGGVTTAFIAGAVLAVCFFFLMLFIINT
jgi:MFS family permease